MLGKLPVPGRPTILITVGQGPTALAVGAGGGCLDIFALIYPFSSLSPSLWETARYRLKYCLKGPLNPKQPTNITEKIQYTYSTHKHKAYQFIFLCIGGWSVGAILLGKLAVLGRPTIWITVGQGYTALAVGADWSCLDIFTLIYSFFPLSPSLWGTARYRLKYCLKGPLNPKQPTNWGWSGGAMVLGKLPVPGRPTILITVGQGPIALAVGAGGGGLDIFTVIYPFSSFSLSLGDGPI